MKSLLPIFVLALCVGGCTTNESGGQGEPRAAIIYDHFDVKQVFLAAYRAGDKKMARRVAAPEAIQKVPWHGDPDAFLDGDSILSGEGGYEIVLEIHSDGHVGANIVDVIVRH
ncbi:MAG: hypothetical protein AAF585_06710 [Verrucomicrobiota bacterium]